MLNKLNSKTIIVLLLLTIPISIAHYEITSQPSFTSSSVGGDWLEGWTYRKAHNITGSTAGAQINYPMMINVRYDSGVDFEGRIYVEGNCRIDFGDIRFTDSNGHASLDYWMQQKVDGVQALFWVEIAYIPQNPDHATIYVYYGNDNASTTSNKDWTFDLATGFEDGTTQGWGISWSTYVTWDDVSTDSFQGDYSRGAGRIYGSEQAGNGDFYEHFESTAYLASGSYRMEGAAKCSVQNSYIIPKEIKLWANGAIVDNISDPGTTWHWLSGNFTIDTGSYVEFDVEFHVRIQNLHTGSTSYYIDSLFVRKWCDPEPAHGGWAAEEASSDKEPPEIARVEWMPTCPFPYVPSNITRVDEPVLVTANVTDVQSGVAGVLLSYRVNGSEWWNTTMVYNAISSLWNTIIPGQSANTTVEFMVYSYDNVGNGIASSIYSFNVQFLRMGDIDGDGDVDIYDIVKCTSHYTGSK